MAMSVINNNFVHHYQILSSDPMPELSAREDGSTLHIIDTGEKRISHDGIWEEDLSLVYAMQQANL